jgi:hypothetical protein
MMNMRKVKASMGAIPDTSTPVPVAEGVENDSGKSSITKDEMVIRELFSDFEFGSNYSTNR